MPSASLLRWSSDRQAELDEVESAHASVGGTGPGRRYATQQINRAFAVILASQFQGFCRDLHDGCIEAFLPSGIGTEWEEAVRSTFRAGRKLDSGNPGPGNIDSDFDRFGVEIWEETFALDPPGRDRQKSVATLLPWRNAIAHQDFKDPRLGRKVLRLAEVRSWRRACHALAVDFDTVMFNHILNITGRDTLVGDVRRGEAMGRTRSPAGPYRVGDRVKITSWRRPIVGEVIVEDRGLISIGGRHYYTVRLPIGEPDDRMTVGYPAEELELAPERDDEALPEE